MQKCEGPLKPKKASFLSNSFKLNMLSIYYIQDNVTRCGEYWSVLTFKKFILYFLDSPVVKNQPANARDTALSLVWDSTCWEAAEPMSHNCQAHALEPMLWSPCSGAHKLQLLKPTCSRAHALQQGYVCAQSCQILCDPMGCSPPVSSAHGIFQARIPGWVAISYSRGSSWPRDWTCIPSTAGGFFTAEPPGKPHGGIYCAYHHLCIKSSTYPQNF